MMRRILAAAAALVLLLSSGCTGLSSSVSGGVIKVVAAEDFWGSIAARLGGAHAEVTSIIANPAVDPHEYESTAADARAFARANYIILNGAGYDTWGRKLLDANPVTGRQVLSVADLLGKKQGDNPHFWYDPLYVAQVIDRITADYQALDPADAAYFEARHADYTTSLLQYSETIYLIKQAYAGIKVGATESIFVYLAAALGLDLVSPPAFMNAVSQGNEPPAAALAEFHRQLAGKQIALLVYNDQTLSTIVNTMLQLAGDNGIPTVGISETIVPAGATFEDWQLAQLTALQKTLAGAG